MFNTIKNYVGAISLKYKVPEVVIYILAAFALIVVIDKLTGG